MATDTQARPASGTIPPANGIFFDGHESPSRTGRTFEVFNPSTGAVIGQAAEADTSDVDDTVEAASRAFEQSGWRKLAPSQRAPILRKVAELIRRDLEPLAHMEALNNGMLLTVAR